MESIRPWVGAQVEENFYRLENFVGRWDCSMSCGRTTTHLPKASENKPTDWHQICRRSGWSVSHLLVCRIPFLCRCVYSCLSWFHCYMLVILILRLSWNISPPPSWGTFYFTTLPCSVWRSCNLCGSYPNYYFMDTWLIILFSPYFLSILCTCESRQLLLLCADILGYFSSISAPWWAVDCPSISWFCQPFIRSS